MISHCALTVEEQRDEHPLWRTSAALATWGLSDSPEHLPSLFHPLRHIPGPKLAAITYLCQFYYNCVRGGMFIFEVEHMHRVYGMFRAKPFKVILN